MRNKFIFMSLLIGLISTSCVQTEAEKGSASSNSNSNAASSGAQDKVFKKLHKGTINLIAEKSVSLESLAQSNSGFDLITISSNGYSISMSEEELRDRVSTVKVPVPGHGKSVNVSMRYGDGSTRSFSL